MARRARGTQGWTLVAGADGAGGGEARLPPTRTSVLPPHPPLSSGSAVWVGTMPGRRRGRRPRGGVAVARGRSSGASVEGEEATEVDVGRARRKSRD